MQTGDTHSGTTAQRPGVESDCPVLTWPDEGATLAMAPRGAVRGAAFSLIELLTSVSIMMVIIFALYAMFNQTQKALRANITQVDVLESGRATAELLGRELEQISASKLQQTVNLFAGMIPLPQGMSQPLVQTDVDDKRILRTNILQEFFFLSRETNKWIGTGYRVIGAENGVGTLYRYTVSTNYYALTYTNLMGAFMHAALTTNVQTGALSTNFHRLTDGVIHLRLTAYDPDGRRLGAETTNMYSAYRILRQARNGSRLGLTSTASSSLDANVIVRQDVYNPESLFMFVSNGLPGYVELELGVLEPATLKRLESFRDAPRTAAAFVRKQAGKVHLFRQRIPIRTVLQQ